jgi:hypothetical protein
MAGDPVPAARAAGLLSESGARTDFATARPTLWGEAGPLRASWWQRAPLTVRAARFLPTGPAVHCIHERNVAEPVCVGEATGLPARAVTHAAAFWPAQRPWLAYLPLPPGEDAEARTMEVRQQSLGLAFLAHWPGTARAVRWSTEHIITGCPEVAE